MAADARSGPDGLRYTVALIEIWGGINGLWGFLRDLGATATDLPQALLPGVAIVGTVLVASVVAGVALWHDRRWGYRLSVPVQLAQLFWFAGGSLTFRVAASGWMLADLFIRVKSGQDVFVVGYQLDMAHSGGYALSVAPRNEGSLSLNLVALAILVWLFLRLKRRRPIEAA